MAITPIGYSVAKETTMKRFLKNVCAILRKTRDSKQAVRPDRRAPTPGLEVRSQVKAGQISFSFSQVNQ
jgi:hypothetical protein